MDRVKLKVLNVIYPDLSYNCIFSKCEENNIFEKRSTTYTIRDCLSFIITWALYMTDLFSYTCMSGVYEKETVNIVVLNIIDKIMVFIYCMWVWMEIYIYPIIAHTNVQIPDQSG